MRLKKARKSTKYSKIEWQSAPDIKRRTFSLLDELQIDWVKKGNITVFRSTSAKTRAVARIWGLGKVWQLALHLPPHYIIEVISEKFDRLSETEKDKVLLHELTHIPKNFSGALVPHIRRGKRSFRSKVDLLIRRYFENLGTK
jgi:predicted metallopeptidase